MEERYEIRGKIGQGGIGSVYRGYDSRMSREVAIKRIAKCAGDPALQEESTKQLVKEAGALASLQHPHIVTIYDVGSDEDGPYVVMELISGKTLDELIENAPLTWEDFRELALQTQEALIAAQELDLIHSDLKPSNLMLTWLPSGKFQVKIVDFGLATLTQSQSKEELETMDAVFGSIFFMPPEQFERSPLDARSDLYSMGCVYYQALTGIYPFSGETGTEVMTAHLHHTVTPIQDLRSDIPMWACDWIMWQINRMPEDRPESARDSLSVFLQNDKNPSPTMSLGTAQAANAVKRPRLIIPGSEPVPSGGPVTVATATTSVPVAKHPTAAVDVPAAGLSQAQSSEQPAPAVVTATGPVVLAATPSELMGGSESAKTKSAPKPLTPPEGSKPSVHTSAQPLPESAPAPVTVALTVAGAAAAPSRPVHVAPVMVKPAKLKLSNAAKTMIAAVMGLLVVLLGWMLLNRSEQNRKTEIYNAMITEAAPGDATEVSVNKVKLEILLEAAANTGVVEHRQTIYKALFLAKSTDGTDVDAQIAKFATTRELLPDVREVLIRDVLRKRKNPAVVPTLMAYARSTKDTRSVVAVVEAIRFMAGDEQFDALLELLVSSTDRGVRAATEETVAEIIKKSKNRTDLTNKIAPIFENSVDVELRLALLRLLGRCGTTKALELVKKSLSSPDPANQIAAATALSGWADDSAFPLLIEFIGGCSNEAVRSKAFDAAIRFVSQPVITKDSAASKKLWTELGGAAKTRGERQAMIYGLVNFDDDWAVKLLEGYKASDESQVSELASKALDKVKDRKKIKGTDK